ncbi:TIGR03943 family putative permease subunit [Bacillus sp. FJAT-28004]|uniref:TIGR03943 family putative permease subunit n=1 Tax=Bacillus sp. FJAT-28004 TaxID=1679165 RepID=UPI0006B47E63|nr:TIGR03943 family protein [Bacillus sp. FJAT-28004]
MIHHLIRAVILTGFALFILYLDRTGEMALYIAPKMELYVKLSALGLYAAAIYQIYAAIQKRIGNQAPSCDCEHEPSPSVFKNMIIYGLFLLPLLLGFLIPTGTLGSDIASKKGIILSGSSSVEETGAGLDAFYPFDGYIEAHAAYAKKLNSQPLISVPDTQFIETLTTLDLFREELIGKEIEISGFVYHEEDMGKERFAVSRFAMNCCSADAMPYGLMVSWPKAMDYADDEWITVKGKLTTSKYMNSVVMTLEAQRIERIKMPETPYVYPDLDFGL